MAADTPLARETPEITEMYISGVVIPPGTPLGTHKHTNRQEFKEQTNPSFSRSTSERPHQSRIPQRPDFAESTSTGNSSSCKHSTNSAKRKYGIGTTSNSIGFRQSSNQVVEISPRQNADYSKYRTCHWSHSHEEPQESPK